MENPEQDIRRILNGLLLGNVAEQTATVAAYFLPDASFASPCFRVPSFTSLSVPGAAPLNSAWAILMIYRLYRVLCPRIEFRVESCVFDRPACILYLSLQQTLAVRFLPGLPRPFRSVSVLRLRPLDRKTFEPDPSNPVRDASSCDECTALAGAGEKRAEDEEGGEAAVLYFVAGQTDYLQGEDTAALLASGLGGAAWRAAKALATAVCVVVAVVCTPVYCALWPEWVSGGRADREAQRERGDGNNSA